MYRLLLVVCSLMCSVPLFGQQIKTREAGFEEYVTLLKAAGYQAFCFDLTELLGGRYDMTMYIKEYESGKQIGSKQKSLGATKKLLTDFSEESRKKITPEMMVDPETQTYKQAEKLTIGFYPSGTDTLANMLVDIPTMRSAGERLSLHGIERPAEKPLYWYSVVPFVLDSFEVGKFIPLVFYGSGWYDEQIGMCRFCGEREIAPDLSSKIVENVPHFYVIGVEFTK